MLSTNEKLHTLPNLIVGGGGGWLLSRGVGILLQIYKIYKLGGGGGDNK